MVSCIKMNFKCIDGKSLSNMVVQRAGGMV